MKTIITPPIFQNIGIVTRNAYLYNMPILPLAIPEDLDKKRQDTLQFIAAKLYESGRITLSQGAEMCGISYQSFMELLVSYEVSLVNYPADEIRRDAERVANRNR